MIPSGYFTHPAPLSHELELQPRQKKAISKKLKFHSPPQVLPPLSEIGHFGLVLIWGQGLSLIVQRLHNAGESQGGGNVTTLL